MHDIKAEYLFMFFVWCIISVADPVHFFRIRIRIRGSGFKNQDPDPGDPKKTGSGYVFDV